MITSWIVRHEVQLLINRIDNKFRNYIFCAKTSLALLKTVENIAKEAIKARVISVKITWDPITGVRLQKVQIRQL